MAKEEKLAAMDADALRLIQTTAVKAAGVGVLPIDGEENMVLIVDRLKGEVREHALPPANRRHKVDTIASLIALAGKWGKDKEVSPVVWVGESKIVLVMDDATRRDWAVMKLIPAPEWQAVKSLLVQRNKSPEWMNQRDFIYLLRLVLGVSKEIVAKFRKLDWSRADTDSGKIEHGRESLGKTIKAEAVGAADLPEQITIDTPVYDNPGERTPYLCRLAVELDPANKGLTVAPEVGEIERIATAARADLVAQLRNGISENIPIYDGEPTTAS